MLEILIDAVVRATETASEVEHVLAVVFMACVFGIGLWWALSLVTKDKTFQFIRGLF
jgi:uncharacterized membrane protein